MSTLTINSLRLWRYQIPFRDAVLTAQRDYSSREGYILAMESGQGATGWGECAPLPGFSRETLPVVEPLLIGALKKLAGFTIGAQANPYKLVEDANGTIGPVPPSVRFGIETALADLYSQSEGRTLRSSWFAGRSARDRIEVNYLLSNDTASLAPQVAKLLSLGVNTFKLKVGRNAEADARLVRQVRELIGAQTKLRLDANRGFTLAQAVSFMQAIESCRIEYIEEPLRDPNPESIAGLATKNTTPIALDETICELASQQHNGLAALLQSDFVNRSSIGVAVIKPAILGGLLETYAVVQSLAEIGVNCVVTSSLDGAVGVTAAAQLAGACGDTLPACGLATFDKLESTLGSEELVVEQGYLHLPNTAGLGMRVDPARCGEYLEEIKL